MIAAVAHFNMLPENSKCIVVYPAYFVALGPSVVQRPWMSDQPAWSDKLFPCGSSIKKGSCALNHVPQLRGGKNEAAFKECQPLLMKQKAPPLDKWTKGVHQILIWIGYSRPSFMSAWRHASRWGAAQWQ